YSQFGHSYPQVALASWSPSVESLVPVILLDSAREFGHLVVDRATLLHELRDLLVRVHDCRVIPVAEELADLRQRKIRQLATQIHRNVPRRRDRLGARRAVKIVDRELEVLRGLIDDVDR